MRDIQPILPADRFQPGPSTLQPIPGNPILTWAQCSSDVQFHARPVAFIRRADGAGGTGFLIAPDLLMTNNHVLTTAADADTCTVWFNFNDGQPGQPDVQLGAVAYRCNAAGPNGFFFTSPYGPTGPDADHLDFTVVRVDWPEPPGQRWGYVPIVSKPYSAIGAPLTIIQHPNQMPTMAGWHAGQLKTAGIYFLHYTTSTDYGSSGSPVLNEGWQLVGLHHARFDFQVGDKLPDGMVVTNANKFANEGLPIAALLAVLQAQNPPLALPPAQLNADGALVWP
jgi:V8-like Glu-specific endopeptidase